MDIGFDQAKRDRTLRERNLDFTSCAQVFAGETLTIEVERRGSNETRYVTYGYLNDRAVVVVWTYRDDVRRIILRHAHRKEVQRVGLDRSG